MIVAYFACRTTTWYYVWLWAFSLRWREISLRVLCCV